jgi:hypothetical protein
MAGDWTDWADGNDLANLSQGTSPLAKLGYDPDELRADPLLRAAAMQRLAQPDVGQNAGTAPAAKPPLTPSRTPTQGPAAETRAAAGATQAAAAPPVQGPAVSGPSLRPRAPAPAAAPDDDEPPNPVLYHRDGTPATSPGGGPPEAPPPELGANLGATLGGGSAPRPGGAPDPQAMALEAARSEQGLGRQAADIYGGLPAAPDTTKVDARIEQETQPTDPRAVDPVTGKRLYKEGLLGEVGRVFNNMRLGAAGKPDQVTPYGAPNADYQYEEARRQGMLARDQAAKADTLARFKALTDAATARAGGLEKAAPLFNDAGTLANNAQRNQTEAAREQLETPEGKAAAASAVSEAQFNERQKDADRIFGPGKGGEMRALYLANGKLPDPKQASAEEIARAQAMRAFRQQNGRMPSTLEEINQVNAAAAGRLKEAGAGADNPNVSAIVADAVGKKQSFLEGWYRDDQGSYRKIGVDRSLPPNLVDKGDLMTPDEMAAKLDQYRLDANKQLAKYGTKMDEHGQVVAAPASPAAQPDGQIGVTAPDGKTYHFPNKKAADAFKAAAGIR